MPLKDADGNENSFKTDQVVNLFEQSDLGQHCLHRKMSGTPVEINAFTFLLTANQLKFVQTLSCHLRAHIKRLH